MFHKGNYTTVAEQLFRDKLSNQLCTAHHMRLVLRGPPPPCCRRKRLTARLSSWMYTTFKITDVIIVFIHNSFCLLDLLTFFFEQIACRTHFKCALLAQ